MIDSETKFYVGLIAVIFFIGWIGYGLGASSVEYQLKEDIRICLEEKEILETEKEEIKEDVAKLLKDFYGKKLVWDVFGVSKYKNALCGVKIYLEFEIPFLDDEIVC